MMEYIRTYINELKYNFAKDQYSKKTGANHVVLRLRVVVGKMRRPKDHSSYAYQRDLK